MENANRISVTAVPAPTRASFSRSPSRLLVASAASLLLVAITLSCIWLPQTASCLDNGLARTPPMGWIAWERFVCTLDCETFPKDCIQSQLFKDMGDQLKARKLDQFGYKYVNIDDCWSEKKRDPATGALVADKQRFAEGILPLADYLHDLGLKVGIYGDCGYQTCGGYPAQLKPEAEQKHEQDNYFDLDAKTFASWTIDSFKFDGCFIDPNKAESVCPQMAEALNRTSRPILLVCEWPFYMMYAHSEPDFRIAAQSCNVWRFYDDIDDSWASILLTIDHFVKHQSTILEFHGPGHWFDPDQLVIGNDGLSWEQEQAQMAVWAIWSAPLYMSNDLRTLNKKSEQILTNKHLISVNQDPLGVFGQMVKERRTAEGSLQAFVKPVLPVKNGCPSFVVLYLNRRTLGTTTKVSFELRELLQSAPVYQAALNQEEVIEFEAAAPDAGDPLADFESGESGDTGAVVDEGAYTDGEGGNESGNVSETDQSVDDGSIINASKCRQRLRTAMNGSPASPRLEYLVTDLLNAGANLGRLAINANLELLVNPSGVSVVRLVEASSQAK